MGDTVNNNKDKKPELPAGEMTLPRIFYNGYYWMEVDEEDETSLSEPKEEKVLTCTCGRDSIGEGKHSPWCDKGDSDV